MKVSLRSLLAPLVGVFVLALVLNITVGALGKSGTWRRGKAILRNVRANPYATLDRVLAQRRPEAPAAAVRNPFAYGGTPTVAVAVSRPNRPAPPPPAPKPLLTSIVWDEDPRATIRFNGRDYSVRPSGLFDDYRVVSITRDQVVLDRAGESLVLRLLPRER